MKNKDDYDQAFSPIDATCGNEFDEDHEKAMAEFKSEQQNKCYREVLLGAGNRSEFVASVRNLKDGMIEIKVEFAPLHEIPFNENDAELINENLFDLGDYREKSTKPDSDVFHVDEATD